MQNLSDCPESEYPFCLGCVGRYKSERKWNARPVSSRFIALVFQVSAGGKACRRCALCGVVGGVAAGAGASCDAAAGRIINIPVIEFFGALWYDVSWSSVLLQAKEEKSEK